MSQTSLQIDAPSNPRLRSDRKITACAAIVRHDHILLVQQGRGPSAGRWTLPGGRLDAGETLAEAATRETLEETGLNVEIDGFVGVYSYFGNSGRQRARFCFSASIAGGRPRFDGREIRDLRWFRFDQLPLVHEALLWKPHVLRKMLGDIQRGQRLPLDLLRNFDRALKCAA